MTDPPVVYDDPERRPRRVAVRPVRDIVILIMVVTVSAVLVVSVVGLVSIQLFRPETDVTAVAGALGHVTQILVGAVLGYLAGRGGARDG